MKKSSRVSALIVVTLLSVCSVSTAQDDKAAAKEAFNAGRTAFESKQYSEAATSFRKAYELMPSWKLHYNIAQAEAAARRYGLALEAFEKYLAMGGDDVPDDRKEEVIGEITRLRVMVGTLEIQAPDGAEIYVDGLLRGTAPLSGKVKVAASIDTPVKAILNGEVIFERNVSAGGGENLVVVIENKADVAAVAVVPVADAGTTGEETTVDSQASGEDADQAKKKNPLWPTGWVLLGVGVAAVGGGVATGAMALSTNKELQDCAKAGNTCDADSSSLNDKQKTLSALSTGLIIGGSAVAATGVVLLIVSKMKDKKESNSQVSFMPAATGSTFGAVLTGRF